MSQELASLVDSVADVGRAIANRITHGNEPEPYAFEAWGTAVDQVLTAIQKYENPAPAGKSK